MSPHVLERSTMCVDSGILLIDKPRGVTSHDIVAAVRSRLHVRRVGHAGTLDPMATGLLIVGFGHATRLLSYIVEHAKIYEATIRFGQSSVTEDADGDVLATIPTLLATSQPFDQSVVIDRSLLEATIRDRFLGAIEQVPSVYSAIKVNGRRAYDLARRGEHVDLAARAVTIGEFNLLGLEQRDASGVPVVDADVRVQCSAGTYIRALARDLGTAIGTGAHLTALRRMAIGDFSIDDPLIIRVCVDQSTNQSTDHDNTEERELVAKRGEASIRHARARVILPDADTLYAHAMPLLGAIRSIMPTLAVEPQEIVDLRFGRKLKHSIDSVTGAYDPATDEVIALLKPDGEGSAQPLAVFPANENET